MLIAVATLTIATANADEFDWKPIPPLQIVNNTNVVLEARTEPSGAFYTLNPNTSITITDVLDTSLLLGWGIDSSSRTPPILNKSFDDHPLQGTMSTTTSTIGGDIILGQVWALNAAGSLDTLVLSGTANGNTMPLSATRQTGVNVYRLDQEGHLGDVFCLDTGVEFNLLPWTWGTCPAGETRVVLADDTDLLNYEWGIDAYDAADLISDVRDTCDWTNNNCTTYSANIIYGVYITGFDAVPTSNSSYIRANLISDPN